MPDKILSEIEEYNGLLKTGMFWEFYPQLSGNYQNKKIGFCKTPNTPQEAETAAFQCNFDEKIKVPLYT